MPNVLSTLIAAVLVLLSAHARAAPDATHDAFSEGVQAYRAKDYVLARQKWEEAFFATHDPSPQNNLAYLLYYGLGQPADPAKAITLWLAAAGAGHAEAQWHLGTVVEDGLALPRDPAKGFAWYRCSIVNAERRSLTGDATLERRIGDDARKSLAQLRPKLSADMLRRGEQMANDCIGHKFEALAEGIVSDTGVVTKEVAP